MAACTREVAAPTRTTFLAGADATTTTTTTTPSTTTTTTATTTTATTAAPATTAPVTAPVTVDATAPAVTSEVVGTAVGGSSGGIGPDQTNGFSELVRNADGTCSGWPGPGGTWTQGLESGAPVIFLDEATGSQIGSGAFGTSAWADVDPGEREQWNCTFPFTGTIEGAPESCTIVVAELEPWLARPDPASAGAVVASVNTIASADVFAECTTAPSGDGVSDWVAVGEYWAVGFPSLCGAGLPVVGIERPCRPDGFASDHIVEVTTAAEPRVVLENADGLQVDPAVLIPGTAVIVHVAVGRPC
jgi:hypothetical protein